MRTFFTLLFALPGFLCFSQYTSPDESLNLTLQDLVENSGGAVIFNGEAFEIPEDITISTTDTLTINGEQILIAEGVLITIQGGFFTTQGTSITQLDCCENHYHGFRFEETSVVDIFGTDILYGGGLQVLTGEFRIEASAISFHTTGQTTGAALDFSTGKPQVIASTFVGNEVAAIGSAANADPAPIITGCTFNGNVTGNSNRPQVNLGPSGADTARVSQNVFQGDPALTNVGGFAFSLLAGGEGHVIFEENTVFDNRYGMTVFGANVTSRIQNNVFLNNDTQGEPLLGGSGISITGFGENEHLILGNSFEGNLWGITLISEAQANLGEVENSEIGPGGNFFDENGNSGETYALFNNTPNTISAQGNCWIASDTDLTLEEAEGVISHVTDDPELGEVIFDPLGSCSLLSTEDPDLKDVLIFPNPSAGVFQIQSNEHVSGAEVYDLNGRRVLSARGGEIIDGRALPDGLYLVRIRTLNSFYHKKVAIKR